MSRSTLPELYERMLGVLRAARNKRDSYGDINSDIVRLRWEAAVRDEMLRAVNTYRGSHGLAPVGAAEVQRVENQATGHIDYVRKFALYCAELALQEPVPSAQ